VGYDKKCPHMHLLVTEPLSPASVMQPKKPVSSRRAPGETRHWERQGTGRGSSSTGGKGLVQQQNCLCKVLDSYV